MNQNHQAKLVVFDWDGTLMDSADHIVACLQNSIIELSLEPRTNDEVKNIIGLGMREALLVLYPQATDAVFSAIVERYRIHFFDQKTDPCELFSGAKDLIQELDAKEYFLAVATGKGRNGLDKILSETGLGEFFPITRCADETHSKPHPQMMLDIIDYYGVEANEAIMVGDTEYDLKMANNAAAHSVAVSYGVHDKQRLLDCKPLTCLDSLHELHEWLLK